MKLEIEFKDARWLVNGKRLGELNSQEERFMDDFFREVKMEAI
jgi:hypothetical protein